MRTFLDKGLLPSGLRARAEVYRWLLFSATELEQPLWRIARHTSIYPPEKRLAAEIPIDRQDFFDMAAVRDELMLLDNLPRLRRFMERMYKRPNAPPRIAEAFAHLRR